MGKPNLPTDSWSLDSDGKLILFLLPQTVSLEPAPATWQQYSHHDIASINLAKLPKDVLILIVNNLHPVDRVCLGLSCKALCAAVLAAPSLSHPGWMRFTQPIFTTHRSLSHLRFPRIHESMPEVRTLVLRLAHGWIDKSRYLYCWKCHLILSRNEVMWRRRLPESVVTKPSTVLGINIERPLIRRPAWFDMLQHQPQHQSQHQYQLRSSSTSSPGTTTTASAKDTTPEGHTNRGPRWSLKTLADKSTWDSWTVSQRYNHLVKIWCYTHTEDSSCLACDFCATGAGDTQWVGILDGANGSVMKEVHGGIAMVHPVECPSCLKKELTASRVKSGGASGGGGASGSSSIGGGGGGGGGNRAVGNWASFIEAVMRIAE